MHSCRLNPPTKLQVFIHQCASLLAFTANSAAQSSAQTHIHSAIVVIDTSNNARHSQVHWFFGTVYLAVKDSNGLLTFKKSYLIDML